MSQEVLIQSTRLLDEIDVSSFNNIIGFDLGHGEFSVSCISKDKLDEAKCVEINKGKKSQITAVATTRNDKVLIGEEAITTFEEIEELWVGFKRRPNGDPIYNYKISLLFNKAIQKSLAGGKINLTKDTLTLVGCPSEWSKEHQREYQSILQKSLPESLEQQPTVVVIPESRAAIQFAKVSGDFSIKELQTSTVVLLDFGSSTVDVTLLHIGKDIHDLDFGCDLGAFLLDELIFFEIVRQLNGRERIDYLNCLRYNSSNIGQCLLKARELKESYFNQEEFGFRETLPLSKGDVDLESEDGEFYSLRFRLTMGQIHNLIYETKLQQIEESVKNWSLPKDLFFFPPAEYSNLSYYEALTKFIQTTNEKLKESCQNWKVTKTLITGGAARMGFVKTITDSAFSQSYNVFMNEPEINVAKGLALRGRAEVWSALFLRDVKDQTFSKIETMIKARREKLYTLVTNHVTKAIKKIINEEVENACESNAKPEDLIENCSLRTDYWISDGYLESKVKSATEKWFTSNIADRLNDSLYEVCTLYSMPAIQIDKKTALRMAKSVNITPMVNLLTVELQGSIITNATENSMDWINKFFRWIGIFNLGQLNSEQRTQLSEEIINEVFDEIYNELANDKKILRKMAKMLTNDIQLEIKKIIAEETCAYL